MRKFTIFCSLFLLVVSSTACGGTKTAKTEQPKLKVPKTGDSSNRKAIAAFRTAVSLHEVGSTSDQVIRQLKKAVQHDPSFGKAWFNLGLINDQIGKKVEARLAYEKALRSPLILGRR